MNIQLTLDIATNDTGFGRMSHEIAPALEQVSEHVAAFLRGDAFMATYKIEYYGASLGTLTVQA